MRATPAAGGASSSSVDDLDQPLPPSWSWNARSCVSSPGVSCLLVWLVATPFSDAANASFNVALSPHSASPALAIDLKRLVRFTLAENGCLTTCSSPLELTATSWNYSELSVSWR